MLYFQTLKASGTLAILRNAALRVTSTQASPQFFKQRLDARHDCLVARIVRLNRKGTCKLPVVGLLELTIPQDIAATQSVCARRVAAKCLAARLSPRDFATQSCAHTWAVVSMPSNMRSFHIKRRGRFPRFRHFPMLTGTRTRIPRTALDSEYLSSVRYILVLTCPLCSFARGRAFTNVAWYVGERVEGLPQ